MKESIQNLIAQMESWKLFDNTLLQYVSFILATLVIWTCLQLLLKFVGGRLSAFATRTKTSVDDHFISILSSIKPWFLFFIAFHLGTRFLNVNPKAEKILSILFVVVMTLQAIIAGSRLLVQVVNTIGNGRADSTPALESTKYNIIAIGRLVIWVTAALFLMDNLGINIAAFVTGLGIGGIAIALAAQAILGDAFSAFTIGLDKPFEPGDFIVVDALKGTVERVGLKTTRVRSLNGELLVFANSDLTKSRIQNFKRMDERRVNFEIGVAYNTPVSKLKVIPDLIKSAIEKGSDIVRFERTNLRKFGDSALIFDVVYWVKSRDFVDVVRAEHAINLLILESFEAKAIEIAFPTRTIYNKNIPAT